MTAANQPKVLVVDDNPVDVRIFKYAFSTTGVAHEIEGTDNGESAMALLLDGLQSGTQMPKLILVDLNLPTMTGIELLRALKANEQLRRIPVIVISSSQFQTDIGRAYEAGASLYLRKPNDLDSLEELVKAVATVWLKYGMVAQTSRIPINAPDGSIGRQAEVEAGLGSLY
jgi:CheY-like chemotaxis protein